MKPKGADGLDALAQRGIVQCGIAQRGIALGGFMGAGKSTVGASLARLLGLPFVDLDRWIEDRAGRSVGEIFASDGEAGFRLREADALTSVCGDGPVVLALGGGTLHQPGNQAQVEGAFTVFVLDVPWEALRGRIGDGTGRPLAAEAEALFAVRRAGYLAAGVAVDGDRPVAVVVAQIASIWRAA
jgi:shikimate kinase